LNKVKLSWGKLVTVLSLGFMVLGIGCVSGALVNIWEQSHYAPLKYPAAGVNVKSDTSLVLPAPDKPLYPVYPVEGDNIGSLTIPALKQTLPVIEGTGADELKKGVGHFTQSVLPGLEDNCVLSGHRDTVFSRLGELKIGDQLIVQTSAGTYTYEIKRGRIVDKDDKTVIVPADHAILTLTTCYPFVYIGSAPERYILIADLVISKK
jgi:sortase A